jgi:uncharacterized protein YjcR
MAAPVGNKNAVGNSGGRPPTVKEQIWHKKKMKVEYAVDATIDVPEKLKYVEEVGTHKQKD